MLVTQYVHRLPADYDMARIDRRAAELGPDWDATDGLAFKAFITQRRGENGAVCNTYSSLYLWLDDEAAIDFITGERFQKVIAGFGRPNIETWLPLDIHVGFAATARSVYREDVLLGPDMDLAVLRTRESERNTAAVKSAGVFAAITALDVATWRLTRFRLSAEAAARPDRGIAYDSLYLAKPGMPALFAAA
jgi:hypothetical protein